MPRFQNQAAHMRKMVTIAPACARPALTARKNVAAHSLLMNVTCVVVLVPRVPRTIARMVILIVWENAMVDALMMRVAFVVVILRHVQGARLTTLAIMMSQPPSLTLICAVSHPLPEKLRKTAMEIAFGS